MRRLLSIALFFVLTISMSFSQVKVLSFEQVVYDMSLSSIDAKKAEFTRLQSNLAWENFNLRKLPTIGFNVNPLSFNQSIKSLQDPLTGDYNYVNDFSNNASAGISITQPLNLTGGKFVINSNLNLLTELSHNKNSFNTTPISVGYQQSIIGGAKSYKYEKRIQAMRFANLSKSHKKALFSIQLQSVQLFMRVLSSKLMVENAIENRASSDTLYGISKFKYSVREITEQESLQAELQWVNSCLEVDNATNQHEDALRKLLSYLGLGFDMYDVSMPEMVLPPQIDYDQATVEAVNNSPFFAEQDLKRIDAEKRLYSARLQNQFNGNIGLDYGLNQFGSQLYLAYQKPSFRQVVSVGLRIPIIDWGVGKNTYKSEKYQYQATNLDIEKSENDMYDGLLSSVNSYNQTVKMLSYAERSLNLSRRQYELLISSFELGEVSFYEISTARSELLRSQQTYIEKMAQTWVQYFTIRSMTLCDFE